MNQVSRTDCIDQFLRIRGPERVFHGIEVIESADVLIESMNRRQILVHVAQMVFPKLTGGVAEFFEHGGDGGRFGGHTDVLARLPHRCEPRAKGELSRNEIRPTSRATWRPRSIWKPNVWPSPVRYAPT